MVRYAEHPLGYDDPGGVAGRSRNRSAALGDLERGAVTADSRQEDVKRGEQAQLMPAVPESLGKSKATLDRNPHLVAVAASVHRGHRERLSQRQFALRPAILLRQRRDGAITPALAFAQKRQPCEQRRGSAGKLDADGGIASPGKAPFERCPNIFEMWCVV